MKRLIPFSLFSLLLCSCSTVKVKTADCEAAYLRFWFEQEGFRATVCGGTAAVAKTSNNTDLLEALLPMAVKGIKP